MFDIIYFGASWCAPCKQMKVILNDLMKKNNVSITFYDIEQNYEQAVRYGITTVPTLIRVDFNFDELERIEGARPKYELEKFIKG